ncbi:hypothetical protein X275_06600 [Marinitoga sp. 1197]|uniref:CPBP family glutamic-type intramembrane protease n=1 Tax=Marinitoga sp. 1197 TaxID=1428449 RepID=UPI000640DC2E|nr:CPBP family intramembrane glutamic endopeptidase [Marinitoga sp. 1197]KLO22079.1 hypothetical protein X275_06600 [Marinitoga sp. 1197]
MKDIIDYINMTIYILGSIFIKNLSKIYDLNTYYNFFSNGFYIIFVIESLLIISFLKKPSIKNEIKKTFKLKKFYIPFYIILLIIIVYFYLKYFFIRKALFFTLIIGGVSEEYFFKAYLFNSFKEKKYNILLIYIALSLAFTLSHYSIQTFKIPYNFKLFEFTFLYQFFTLIFYTYVKDIYILSGIHIIVNLFSLK